MSAKVLAYLVPAESLGVPGPGLLMHADEQSEELRGAFKVRHFIPLVSAEWQPMDTAPTDGTRVLLLFKPEDELPHWLGAFGGVPFVGSNRADSMHWCFAAPVGAGGFVASQFVGWQPLPPVPAVQP